VAIIGGLCISLSIVLISVSCRLLPLVENEDMRITIVNTCNLNRQNCSELADNANNRTLRHVVRREEGGNGNNEDGQEGGGNTGDEKGSNEQNCCTNHKKGPGEFLSSYTMVQAALYLSIAAHLACVVLLTLMCVMCCTWFEKMWNMLLVVAAAVALGAALSTVWIVWTMCLSVEMIKQQAKDIHTGNVDFNRTDIGLGTVGIVLSAFFSVINLLAAIALCSDFQKTGRHEAIVPMATARQEENKSFAQ
jgi:hypothetical protein